MSDKISQSWELIVIDHSRFTIPTLFHLIFPSIRAENMIEKASDEQ